MRNISRIKIYNQFFALLVLLCLLMLHFPLGAETIQIGAGDLVNMSMPFEPAAVFYTYSQQLFSSQELGNPAYITALGFQYQIASTNFIQQHQALRFYLGHSNRSTLTSWVPLDSLSLVWDGLLQSEYFSSALPGSGWLTLQLDIPFAYNGIDNLVIACDENTPGFSTSNDDFLAANCASPMAVLYKSPSINPDPADPPDTSSGDFYIRNCRSNLRLELVQEHYLPYQPFPANGAVAIDISALNLSWQSSAQCFDLYFGTNPASLDQIAHQISSSTFEISSELQMLTDYYWRVVAYQEDLPFVGDLWQFRTRGEELSAPQNLSGSFIADHVLLEWEAPQHGSIVEYEIYRNNQLWQRTAELYYEDYEVLSGAIYYYYVRGVNNMNQFSPPSNTVTVTIPNTPDDLILQEGFEAYPAFSTFVPLWQNLDLDASQTWNWEAVDYPSEGSAMGWMVFAPLQTSPPLSDLAAWEGVQMLMAMSSLNPPNSDWIILPRCHLGTNPQFSFQARSYTADFGLERMRVLISTTDANPASFVPLSTFPHLAVPVAWTEYSFDLSVYQNQNVYLALQCVSWDAFALFVDEIVLRGEGAYLSTLDNVVEAAQIRIYPNPSAQYFWVENSEKSSFDISIYDLRGRKLHSEKGIREFDSSSMRQALARGIYLLKIKTKAGEITRKVLISK